MPIRSDTGRGAVLRRLFRWPLYSTRRAVGSVLVVCAVGFAGAQLGPLIAGSIPTAPPGPPAHAAPAQPVTAAPTPSEALPAPITPSITPIPPQAVPPEALQTARDFMARWVVHPPGITGQQWAASMAPLTMPEFLAQMATVNPANIPATRVTGDPMVTTATPTVVQVNVPTDTTPVHLVLLQLGGHWQVRSYDQADSR